MKLLKLIINYFTKKSLFHRKEMSFKEYLAGGRIENNN